MVCGCFGNLFGEFGHHWILFWEIGAPCQPLGEKEEGHCDEQVESPICRRRNTEMKAHLGKVQKKRKIMVLIPKMGG